MNLGILKLFSFFILSVSLFANVQKFDFDLIKKGNTDNNTLLIVGGIQGDEPGGFMAASLITTHYEINKGSVWVIPNLNFYSIIKRGRGAFGDMNRKFASISSKDPDYNAVKRIKEYIANDNVKLILNLHDGSGFYREKHIDKIHSPYKWGQSSIIDQASINTQEYGDLYDISSKVCEYINSKLIRQRDFYTVKNTKTRLGDKEMEQTLTYYAINLGKAAFGNEASKELPLHERTYYHLLAIEKYMQIMNIEYKRKFELTPMILKDVIDNDISISFYDDKIKLPLREIRNRLTYFPIKKDGNIDFLASNPLMTVIKDGNLYNIHYGNRRVSRLSPDYFELNNELKNVNIKIDGKIKEVEIGSLIKVKDEFLVKPKDNIRVNIIGYVNKAQRNEAGLMVSKTNISKKYSIDKKGKIYRVEFYKDEKFAGMILVKFIDDTSMASNNEIDTTKEL